MSIREYIDRNSQAITVVCVLAVVIAAWLAFGAMGDKRVNSRKWMFDLNAQQLVVAPRTTISPTDMGSGGVFNYPGMKSSGSIVDAALYSCGDVGPVKHGMTLKELDAMGVHIGYLSRYTDPAHEFILSGEDVIEELPIVVSDVSGQAWYSSSSDASSVVYDPISRLCGGDVPKALRP
ncbi:MAG: hypothetical protein AAGH99_12725 [Planctomycetota bacterium]